MKEIERRLMALEQQAPTEDDRIVIVNAATGEAQTFDGVGLVACPMPLGKLVPAALVRPGYMELLT